jgi:hypothetical protein
LADRRVLRVDAGRQLEDDEVQDRFTVHRCLRA